MVAQNSHKLTNKIAAKTIRNRQYNRNSAINWMPEIMQSVSKAYMVAFRRSNLRNGNARPPTLPIATTQIQTRFQDHHRKLPHCSQHHTRRRKSTKTPTEPSATAVRYNKRFPARTNPISTYLATVVRKTAKKLPNKITAKAARNCQYNHRETATNWMAEIMQSVSKANMVGFRRTNLRKTETETRDHQLS
jgi:hypothetical protein